MPLIIHKPPFKLKEIKIELTYKCPLACIHCSSDATPAKTISISIQKCSQVINDAAQMGVHDIAFSGGEPLLYEELDTCIALSAQRGLRTTIYTSGNVPLFEQKIRHLKKVGLNRIVFSIFGPNAIQHESITRKKGSFDKTINAISSAIKTKTNVELHFVALARNFKLLPQVIELAKQLGVKTTSVLRFVPQGRGSLLQQEVLTKDQYLSLKEIIETLRRAGNSIRTGSPFNFLLLSDQPACESAITRIIVAPDLRIYPCDAFKQILCEEIAKSTDYSTLDNYSLEECWNLSPYLNKIRNYLTTDFDKPCVICRWLENCLSGCLAQKVLAFDSMDKNPDPACIRTFLEKG